MRGREVFSRIARRYDTLNTILSLGRDGHWRRRAIAYLPDGKVVGISKLARVVDSFSRRPQVQERMTSQIAQTLMDELKPQGVGVVIRAEHMCMRMRGVEKPNSSVVTSALLGCFQQRDTRQEFMNLIR